MPEDIKQVLTADEQAAVLGSNPFDGDFGAPDDRILLDRIGIARKAGACSFCETTINPGDQQRRMSAKFDGQLRSYRWCVPCCRNMAGMEDDEGEWDSDAQRAKEE